MESTSYEELPGDRSNDIWRYKQEYANAPDALIRLIWNSSIDDFIDCAPEDKSTVLDIDVQRIQLINPLLLISFSILFINWSWVLRMSLFFRNYFHLTCTRLYFSSCLFLPYMAFENHDWFTKISCSTVSPWLVHETCPVQLFLPDWFTKTFSSSVSSWLVHENTLYNCFFLVGSRFFSSTCRE